MTGPLYRVGRFCARYHWLVIAVWVVVAVAVALGARAAGDRTSDNLRLPGTGSTRATDLLSAKLPAQQFGTNPLAMRAPHGKLTDSQNKDAVESTVTALKKVPHVTKVVDPLSSQGAALLSKDKTIAYIPVTLNVGSGDLTKDEAQAVLDAAKPAQDAGLQPALGGYAGKQLSKTGTEKSEAIGLVAAMVILLFAFGTATAMALPLVTAVLGLVITLGVIRILGHATQVPTTAPTLATMIGLGVGIDYALFIVTRDKLQLREGLDFRESTARAAATAGGAVCFAGGTVVIALVSMAAAGIPLVTTLGYTAGIAVFVAVLGATTLLPALLGALDWRINALRVKLGRTHPDDHQPHGWRRWAEGVARRPWPSMIAAVAILVVLALPLLQLHLGQNDVGALPKSTTARQAYDLLSDGFGPGTNGPLLIAAHFGTKAAPDQNQLNQIKQKQKSLQQSQQKQTQQLTGQLEAQGVPPQQAQKQAQQQVQSKTKSQSQTLATDKKHAESPATDPRLTKLENAIAKTPGVKSVAPATLDKGGTAAVFTAIPTTAPSDRKTEDLVKNLRDNVIPDALKGSNLTASVGGQTAGYIDLAERVSSKLPSMIAIVVGLSFLVLLLGFRSIPVPLKAAVMNLLSVAAAYGIVTAIFQKGWGASVIGLPGAVPIVSFVPLLMFAILFGLSMDYEVFLMSQIQEHYEESGDARRAVIDGLANTGRVITSAALIMVFVFASFLLNGDPTVKQFGIGLAAAIAIDATIVRCLLVPAVMVLLGRSAWWLPRWLGRVLPRISIEDEGYFEPKPAPALASETARGPAGG